MICHVMCVVFDELPIYYGVSESVEVRTCYITFAVKL